MSVDYTLALTIQLRSDTLSSVLAADSDVGILGIVGALVRVAPVDAGPFLVGHVSGFGESPKQRDGASGVSGSVSMVVDTGGTKETVEWAADGSCAGSISDDPFTEAEHKKYVEAMLLKGKKLLPTEELMTLRRRLGRSSDTTLRFAVAATTTVGSRGKVQEAKTEGEETSASVVAQLLEDKQILRNMVSKREAELRTMAQATEALLSEAQEPVRKAEAKLQQLSQQLRKEQEDREVEKQKLTSALETLNQAYKILQKKKQRDDEILDCLCTKLGLGPNATSKEILASLQAKNI